MFKVTKYPHGTISWADCNSTDAEKAKKFYVDVMGWGTQEIPMGDGLFYTMFTQDGAQVAAISPMQQAEKDQGMPSHWNNYITVDDVDSMVDKIKSLGGTVLAEPFDVFDSGRMLILQDPTGGIVALWQPKNHIGAGLVNTPGAMTWNELSTRDTGKAQEFYGKLLGWEFTTDDNGYNFIMNKGRMNGGFIQMDESWGEMPPAWMTYFSVADIDETINKVEASGGKKVMGIVDAQNVGRFAVVSDPAGAVCSLIQLNEPQKWEE